MPSSGIWSVAPFSHSRMPFTEPERRTAQIVVAAIFAAIGIALVLYASV